MGQTSVRARPSWLLWSSLERWLLPLQVCTLQLLQSMVNHEGPLFTCAVTELTPGLTRA